ncbi:MAG: N-acetylneuraminate lyase [Clostridiales bacterium]|nr:N-acetylneuraminate lyase [Clostridiales bacterium]
MDKKFQGLYPALPTPYDEKGDVNVKSLERLVEYNLDKGVKGFYVAGSTGEAFMLSDKERNLVYETVAKTAGGRANLFAHIGAVSTAQAISFGRTAEKLGYDAVSAVPPFYYKFSFQQIKKHYFDIVSAVDLPMIIYNVPIYSGIGFSADEMAEFFGDPRFLGVKFTSNDFYTLERFKTRFPDRYIFNGFDEMFLAGLSMGADGGIGSCYNFMAEKFIKIRELFLQNKMAEALEIQKEVNSIVYALFKVGVLEGTKEVVSQLGIECGNARAPFSVLTPEQKQFIRENITEKL